MRGRKWPKEVTRDGETDPRILNFRILRRMAQAPLFLPIESEYDARCHPWKVIEVMSTSGEWMPAAKTMEACPIVYLGLGLRG